MDLHPFLLLFALTLSISFFVIAWRAPGRPRLAKTGIICMSITVIYQCMIFLTPVLIQCLVTIFALTMSDKPGFGKHITRRLAVVGFVLGWSVGLYFEWTKRTAYYRLRDENPIESLQERILPPLPAAPPQDGYRYDQLIKDLKETEQPEYIQKRRTLMLKRLHEQQFKWFANSPGFGVVRMTDPTLPSRSFIHRYENFESMPQPSLPYVGIESSGSETPWQLYNSLHNLSLFNFVRSDSWGVRSDDGRQIGFRPHGFTLKPPSPSKHVLERVELVGLLKHPTPVVYVTANLPRMDELAGVPTRDPDAFEADGIAKIIAGDDLIAKRIGTTVRLLGSIRTLASCLECHTGNKGDLLGAFSYRLTMDGN